MTEQKTASESGNERMVRIILEDFHGRICTVIKNTIDHEQRFNEALDLLASDILQLLNDQPSLQTRLREVEAECGDLRGQLAQKDAEIARLKVELKDDLGYDLLDEANKKLSAQAVVMERMRVALKFYADEDNWGNGGFEGHPSDYIRTCNRGWHAAREARSLPLTQAEEEVKLMRGVVEAAGRVFVDGTYLTHVTGLRDLREALNNLGRKA